MKISTVFETACLLLLLLLHSKFLSNFLSVALYVFPPYPKVVNISWTSTLDRLSESDLIEVYEDAFDASDRWFDIGCALGQTPGSLNMIRIRNRTHLARLREVIWKWLQPKVCWSRE